MAGKNTTEVVSLKRQISSSKEETNKRKNPQVSKKRKAVDATPITVPSTSDFADTNQVNPSQNWLKFKEQLERKNKDGHPSEWHHIRNKKHNTQKDGKKTRKFSTNLTEALGLDCEFVGVGSDGSDNMLARASLVNMDGECVYDAYVKPTEEVKDYRTRFSGIRESDIVDGEEFSVVQKRIFELLKGRLLVGHSLKNDLKVLHLSHPRRMTRDTALFGPFRQYSNGRTPSLKKLALNVLDVKIQIGEHDSIIDARAAMQLYMMYKNEWEKLIRERAKVKWHKTMPVANAQV